MALKTVTGSYRTIHTAAAGNESIPATTGFILSGAPPTDSVDLLSFGGGEDMTDANALVVAVYATATDADTCTIDFFGTSDGGSQEYICSVDYIFGAAQALSTLILWADTATVTSHHTTTIQEGGAETNDIKRIAWDMTGFRYINAYVTAASGATNFVVLARYF